MFSTTWKTSERKYTVQANRNVKILMSDGINLDCDIFRPLAEEKFPAILSAHPYNKEGQIEPIKVNSTSAMVPHPGEERTRGSLETGDPNFYARRGFVHVVMNIRGTGLSEGLFELLGPREVQDIHEAIEWCSKQPWCDGNVGMFGVSYLAMIQLMVAGTNPPHLKCIFAPWGTTDMYRDMFYHGGILQERWLIGWVTTSFIHANMRPKNESIQEWGRTEYLERVFDTLKQSDIGAIKELVAALSNPEKGHNPFTVDILLHSIDDSFWEKRKPAYENIKVPCYIGADWGTHRGHLPAAFRSWETIGSTKRMLIGPVGYLDKPLYQLQYESLRWFDYWLKGIETGITQEPPIKLFVPGTGEWKDAAEWPLPQTKWTPFYFHERGLLSEREHWPHEGSDSFFDSPWSRGYLEYTTPTFVENTEILGPSVANIYASTTDAEVLWFLSLIAIDPDEKRKLLTTGWLRGTHREVDQKKSKPWYPHHPHNKADPIQPNRIYEFNIAIVPTARAFKAGERLSIVVASSETQAGGVLGGHIKHQYPSRVTVFHNDVHPSHILLPITSGNVIGTYISGGQREN